MKKTKLLLTSTVLAILSATVYGQTFLPLNGDWNVDENWSTGAVPTGGGLTAIINSSRTANITSDAPAFAGTLRVGNQNDPALSGSLNIGADLPFNGNFQIAGIANSSGFVTQTAGAVTFNANLQIAAQNSGATGEYTISGGTLTGTGATALIVVGTQGTGLFHVTGESASISANRTNFAAGATLRFTLGESGVSPITLSGNATIGAGATLIVDGAAFNYPGSLVSIPLIQADNMTAGNFGSNVTFLNFGALTPTLSQSGGNLDIVVIPEPRVYGLALGLLALAWIGMRRFRARACSPYLN